MMMSTRFLAALAIMAAVSGCGGAADDPEAPPSETANVRIISPAGVDRLIVSAAVADDEDERRAGLRGVASLPEGRGLLIVLPVEDDVCITNADVVFPIDAVFAAADGTIVAVERNIPSRDVRLRCHASTRRILEVNGGAASRVAAGDQLLF